MSVCNCDEIRRTLRVSNSVAGIETSKVCHWNSLPELCAQSKSTAEKAVPEDSEFAYRLEFTAESLEI